MAPPMRSSFTFPIEMKAAKNIDNKCLRIWQDEEHKRIDERNGILVFKNGDSDGSATHLYGQNHSPS